MSISVTVTRGDHTVVGQDHRLTSEPAVDLETLCGLAADVASTEGAATGELGLHLVDSDEIAVLNVEHLGGVGPTDVLAFPLDADPSADDVFLPDEPTSGFAGGDNEASWRQLGDVVLAPTVAAAQAKDHVGTFEGEVALLVVHGVLHLIGHDHAEPDETALMQARERFHLTRVGVRHPVES